MRNRKPLLATLSCMVALFLLSHKALAADFDIVDGLPGGTNWSSAANWSTAGFPNTNNDVAIFSTGSTNLNALTYDSGASGVLGAIESTTDNRSYTITLTQNLLLDYTGTGSAGPAGFWTTRGKDNGMRPTIDIPDGFTLTLNGLAGNFGRFSRHANTTGGGTLEFQPNASGQAYFRVSTSGSTNTFVMNARTSDLTNIAEIVSGNQAGTGTLEGHWFSTTHDNNNPANSPVIKIGRAAGATQTFSGAGTTASDRQFLLRPGGSNGRYGPVLEVTASGTDSAPNLIVFEKEGLSGLSFADSDRRSDAGSWMRSVGSGVARLVVEGDFLIGDNYFSDGAGTGFHPDTLWNSTQIQLQMAGEETTSTAQALRYAGTDFNAGGTGDLFDFSGMIDNFALRKLIIGSDEGSAENAVDLALAAASDAMYVYGLEFEEGAFLNIADADDFIYVLGNQENVAGIAGMGYELPEMMTLADFTNRPENIIILGDHQLTTTAVPEPTSLFIWSLIGLGVLSFGYYRRRRRNLARISVA